MKKLLNFTLACLLMFVLSGCGNKTTDLSTIGTVDGEKVPQALYYFTLKNTMDEIAQEQGESGDDFWKNGKIDDKNAGDYAKEQARKDIEEVYAVRAEAKRQGIQITSDDRKEMDDQVQTLKDSFGGEEAYNKELASYGINDSIYREVLLNIKYEGKLAEKYKTELKDETVKEYYNKNMKRIKHVLYKTAETEEDGTLTEYPEGKVKAAKSSADLIAEKAKNGDDFDKLVTEYSEDTGSAAAPDGYVIGPNNTKYVKPFVEAALKLKVGDVSPVVKSEFGYHVLKAYELLPAWIEIDTSKDEVKTDMWEAERKKIHENAKDKITFDQAKLDAIPVEE